MAAQKRKSVETFLIERDLNVLKGQEVLGTIYQRMTGSAIVYCPSPIAEGDMSRRRLYHGQGAKLLQKFVLPQGRPTTQAQGDCEI